MKIFVDHCLKSLTEGAGGAALHGPQRWPAPVSDGQAIWWAEGGSAPCWSTGAELAESSRPA